VALIPVPAVSGPEFTRGGQTRLKENSADRKSLFQGFWTAGDVDAVKAIFMPISWGIKKKTIMVLHHGGHHRKNSPARSPEASSSALPSLAVCV
jgi:hypothetical protein